jgi:hypothetical protein
MPDIFLRPGDAVQNDVVMRDPAQPDAMIILGVGDDWQEEQTDVGVGLVVGAAVPAVSAGGRRGRIRWRPTIPVYLQPRRSGHGDASQALQFSEGTGHRRVMRSGAGQSGQMRQGSEGVVRLDFEALNEQELLELILVEAA